MRCRVLSSRATDSATAHREVPGGRSGITSSRVMDDVEAVGRAVEVGSNFFLFFTSRLSSMSEASHSGHHGSDVAGLGMKEP